MAENMAAPQTPGSQGDTTAELTAIKMLQSIVSDMSGLNASMDAVQTTVEKLGTWLTEVEGRISVLEEQGHSPEVRVEIAVKSIMQLRERVTYLEDNGHCNNVHIVGVVEDAEGRDDSV